jgi:hypothetical protein
MGTLSGMLSSGDLVAPMVPRETMLPMEEMPMQGGEMQ